MKTSTLLLMSTFLGIVLLFQDTEIGQRKTTVHNTTTTASNTVAPITLQHRYTVTFGNGFYATCNTIETLKTSQGERIYETKPFEYTKVINDYAHPSDAQRYWLEITDLKFVGDSEERFFPDRFYFNGPLEIIDLTKIRSSEQDFPYTNRWNFENVKVHTYKIEESSSGGTQVRTTLTFTGESSESIIAKG